MSSEFNYNITESFKSGIDFYAFTLKFTSAEVQIESNISATSSKISYASSLIECSGYNANLGFVLRFTSATIDSTSSVDAVATKIAISNIDSISVTSETTSISSKIAYASSLNSIDSDVQVATQKITIASCQVSIQSTVETSGKKISFGISSVNSTTNVVVVAIKEKTASATINAFSVITTLAGRTTTLNVGLALSSSILATAIKFAVNDIPDTSSYRTLFVLDNKPLTNHGRTLTSDQSMVFIENKNWNNLKSRYYKRTSSAGRTSFNLSWTFLPNSRYDTVDRRYARDFIKEIAADPDVHVLKVINNDSDDATPYTETSYNVFIRDYSETLVRRDLQNDVYYWDCNLTLEEA